MFEKIKKLFAKKGKKKQGSKDFRELHGQYDDPGAPAGTESARLREARSTPGTRRSDG